MTNFSQMSDDQLEHEVLRAVGDETKAQTYVLHVLAEVERRRIYSKTYPSLFEYCVKVLKYSAGSAQRRIDTMRAMKLIPEIETKLMSGELNLTTVAQAQQFWRREAKAEKPYSLMQKRALLEKLENKSTKECLETLTAISPESIPQEKRRILTPEKTSLNMVIDKALIEKLDRIKSLMSHKSPYMTDRDLLEAMADIVLLKIDPLKKVTRAAKATAAENLLPPAEVRTRQDGEEPMTMKLKNEAEALSAKLRNEKENLTKSARQTEVGRGRARRYIPAQLRREVWARDQGRCTKPGCNSIHFLEIDHIKPIALGGQNELSNLRLLCRAHNQRAAIGIFGPERMNQYAQIE